MKRNRRFLAAAVAGLVLATAGCSGHNVPDVLPSTGDGEKVLYLTFDDGPGDETIEILDLLREYDAKAVFFALGQELAQQTDLGRRIVAEGHVLANHTWNHKDLTGLDTAGRKQELEQAAELLDQLGSDSTCIRPPYGATNDEVKDYLSADGMQEALWTVDSKDWTAPGVDTIVSELLRAESGDVVLMHDGGGDRTQTVEALREALPKLADQGYTFDTVPGC
ncbi:polysaccharide deacetylase family protein [Phytoactinopolyspora endophytica]|uniref:polysaccharide deacetylase family protein n=1 Tax=Phytoactinopolyspora endophytica TaxID=1642495 RepID=UPI00101C6A76|nr:polysaccharide deacetylase family protein [Phytoactinopolyspora endophytica]